MLRHNKPFAHLCASSSSHLIGLFSVGGATAFSAKDVAGDVRCMLHLALDGAREPGAQLPRVIADHLRCGPVRMVATLRDAVGSPIEQRLPLVDVPVLLVRGQHDSVAPRARVEHAAALLPDAAVVVVPGGAHGINYSCPAQLVAAGLPFLTGTAPTPST